MLVFRRVTLSYKFANTHIYFWVDRGTVGVKCLAQEHNIIAHFQVALSLPIKARLGV